METKTSEPNAGINDSSKAECQLMAKAIQGARHDNWPAVARILGLTDNYRGRDYMAWEAITFEIMRRNTDGSQIALLDAVAEAFIRCAHHSDFSGWSHSLCHTFERYRELRGPAYSTERGVSLLEEPNRAVATKLIEAAVQEAKRAGEIGCVDRIIRPLLALNIDAMDINDPTKPFVFLPEVIRDPEFIKILDNEYTQRDVAFCQSHSPDELLRRVLPIERERRDWYPPEAAKLIPILEHYRDIIPEAEMARWVRDLSARDNPVSSLQELTDNLKAAAEARQLQSGIFVDIEGTLLSGERVNEVLLTALREQKRQGIHVVLFTGGNAQVLTERLRIAGIDEDLLPVKPKRDFRGKVLELLVDDSEPECQGLGAASYLRPLWWGEQNLECGNGQWRWNSKRS